MNGSYIKVSPALVSICTDRPVADHAALG